MARHVHADLIEEWLNDTSIEWQTRRSSEDRWQDVNPGWDAGQQYRKKPREFQEGHWYPAVDKEGDKFIIFSDGGNFLYKKDGNYATSEGYAASDFHWIGESLGKLKFG